ncbi:hypothetical protein DM860_007448 [Cuscuta australis]|uniref:BZIP domain-containing protein n=1 Tax=Cuscuta australis TaxID=267555 RepID=A0A328E587_9ASTE|nr:hypothetical protein DM860_007448 [Cuscuta australis]
MPSVLTDEERYAGVDEKKRKRMISNKESARRSRMKKQKLILELTEEVRRLQHARSGINGRIDETREKLASLDSENDVLKARTLELNERFESLNDMIKNFGIHHQVDPPPPHHHHHHHHHTTTTTNNNVNNVAVGDNVNNNEELDNDETWMQLLNSDVIDKMLEPWKSTLYPIQTHPSSTV